MRVRLLATCLMMLLTLSACTTVQPWERGRLAKPIMAWNPDGLNGTLRQHVYFSKEATSGGSGVGGGGCGCN